MRLMTWILLASVAFGATAQAQTRSFDDPEVQAGLEALKKEPSIQTAHRAALQFFNIDAETVQSMRSRAAWKSALPSVTLTAKRTSTDVAIDRTDLLNFPNDSRPYLFDNSEGVGMEYQASASWSLPRLVFNPEVLDVSSLAVLQEGVLKEITRLYYTRRRLQVDLILSPPRDPASKLSKELRIEELTATLDAMTGNLFARAAEARAKRNRRRRSIR